MIKRICCIILCVLLTTSTFGTVSAKWGTENAKVLFQDIKISVDNNVLKPDTEPFIYQGRTYIPARALAEAMGGVVTWDEKNSTVSIYDLRSETISNYYDSIYLLGTSTRLQEISENMSICKTILTYEYRGSDIYNKYYENFIINRDAFNNMKSEYINMANLISKNSTCYENRMLANKLLSTITLLEENINLLSDLYISFDFNKAKRMTDNWSAIAINNIDTRSIIYEFINK